MNGRDITALGYREGPLVGLALRVCKRAIKKMTRTELDEKLRAVLASPQEFAADVLFGELASALVEERDRPYWVERVEAAPYRVWGEGLEAGAIEQMKNAVRLPVAVSGALMPDAHIGYGLPIGGVLATEGCVIPYAVGVDIACRMKLSVFDVPASEMKKLHDALVNALKRETLFGAGATFRRAEDHDVMSEDWGITGVTRRVFEKAKGQLGSSGSGNHFVEFGVVESAGLGCRASGVEGAGIGYRVPGMEDGSARPDTQHPIPDFSLPEGTYLAVLSHSGSRGAGAQVADHYSRVARDLHPELPLELKHLAWLDLSSGPGLEYWAAMELMGRYAAANHAIIHRKIARVLGVKVIAGVENHHNFAWKETHGGREVIVHRKGATPAGVGVMGVIPGSMAAPGFVVRGRGVEESLMSASHGAGRAMSRTAAREKFRWARIRPLLEERGVELLSAGIDESPLAYKDIETVMASQRDLVDVVARFDPKIVRMADAGEKAED